MQNLEQSFHACDRIDYYRPDSMGVVGPLYPHLNWDLAADIPPFFRSIDLSHFAELAKDPLSIFNPKQPNETLRTECITNNDRTKKIYTIGMDTIKKYKKKRQTKNLQLDITIVITRAYDIKIGLESTQI